jgi:hypothetical protein
LLTLLTLRRQGRWPVFEREIRRMPDPPWTAEKRSRLSLATLTAPPPRWALPAVGPRYVLLQAVTVGGYELVSANDCPERDPAAWRLEAVTEDDFAAGAAV